MDILVSELLLNMLMISITLSAVVMATIQKFKSLTFIKKEYHIFILNLLLSFSIGIPFTYTFYEKDIILSLWISLFSFIGAPGIYELLKKQNIINYTPRSLSNNTIQVNKNNLIR